MRPNRARWAPHLNIPKNGQKDTRTRIGQEPHCGHFQPLASGNHKSPASVPLHSGEGLSFTNVLCTKDLGMVHIWYNIPLCTNFSQKSNCDVSRSELCLFNSSPQIHHPFESKSFQSFSLAIPGAYQKTIRGPQPPDPAGVGLYFLFRIIPRVISRGYKSFNQFSRHQVLQYSLDNSIGPYRLYSSKLYGLGPFGLIHIPLWEFSHTAQFSRWPELY
ncbi:hypothetical protein O181_077837 [Austropuccinia psidii MF-1]|uniref:Uncharacterized protein n=1 Tax=Austropuccinia psidii MF-1 TaxID=1389203 RepID=A0A9Q3IF23_9BASI|nr:hypothetical protein [Austropuccinia psidii MF-1]